MANGKTVRTRLRVSVRTIRAPNCPMSTGLQRVDYDDDTLSALLRQP